MLLQYLAEGERRYGLKPMMPFPRKRWAFQFHVRGLCSMLIREKGAVHEERLETASMTVAGPDCYHGWGGESTDGCEVLVFQFDDADYRLRSLVGQDGWRVLPISASDVETVRTLHGRCLEARRSSGVLSSVVFQIVALELALLFLKNLPRAELGPPPDFEARKVAEALAWYGANLALAPNIQTVAQALHLSPAHFRRLFHKVQGLSPKAAFARVQFERAAELMQDPAMTFERIAENAGFGSASAFSRAFKAEFGISPKAYRARLHTF